VLFFVEGFLGFSLVADLRIPRSSFAVLTWNVQCKMPLLRVTELANA
jgi:hypothetical protein